MLSSAFEGYWDADDATLKDIANTWAAATVANGVACCDCSCGNVAMMEWAIKYVNADLLAKLLPKLYEATQNPLFYTNSTDLPTNSSKIDSQTVNSTTKSNATETVMTNSSSTSQSQSSSGNTNIPGSSQGNMVGTDYDASANSQSDSNAGMSDAAGEGRSVEVSEATSTPVAPKDVSMPIAIIVCVIALVALIGVGYFRNKKDDDDYYNDDNDDFEYK